MGEGLHEKAAEAARYERYVKTAPKGRRTAHPPSLTPEDALDAPAQEDDTKFTEDQRDLATAGTSEGSP